MVQFRVARVERRVIIHVFLILVLCINLLSCRWTASDTDKHIAKMDLTHSIRLFQKMEFCSLNVFVKQIGPAYVQLFINTRIGPLVVLQTVTPVEPFLQKVVHTFYAPRFFMAPLTKFVFLGECIMVSPEAATDTNKQ